MKQHLLTDRSGLVGHISGTACGQKSLQCKGELVENSGVKKATLTVANMLKQ
ncbi:hypothetical protein A2U01_0029092, partial [Trifolium medium]|nr:hypothetical protein [Trifolium medium]